MWASDERLADLLADYCTRVEPGQTVLLEAPTLAAPLVRALYAKVLEAGAHPLPRLTIDGAQELFLREAGDAQLDWVNPRRADDLRLADVRIIVYADWNSRALTAIDPAKQARVARAYEPVATESMQRAARGELNWVVVGYPSSSGAQDAEMSLDEYSDFVHSALLLDRDDPADAWRELARDVTRVESVLNEKQELRVVGDGTDLRLRTEGRSWVGSVGLENMPDGEVFTGPIEDSVDGTIRFSFPAIFQGHEVEDVRLRFEGGEVVEATASRGQEFLREMIAMDEGARRVGEFAFGLNDGIAMFTKNILFDEKIGGTVHMALGASYPETGGVNRSGLHWDMICDLREGSEVYADGELIYRDGAFLI